MQKSTHRFEIRRVVLYLLILTAMALATSGECDRNPALFQLKLPRKMWRHSVCQHSSLTIDRCELYTDWHLTVDFYLSITNRPPTITKGVHGSKKNDFGLVSVRFCKKLRFSFQFHKIHCSFGFFRFGFFAVEFGGILKFVKACKF